MNDKYYREEIRDYYPSGGLDDFCGPYNTIEEAQKVEYDVYWQVWITRVSDNVIKRIGILRLGKWEMFEETE